MKIHKRLGVFLFIMLLVRDIYAQKYTELGQTPPMGWNSWNTFQTNINENMLKDMVDSLVAKGMKDVGYEYFVLDDGWMAMQRDANGNLVADPVKFPSGMKALADYVHSKGLKFGIYNCAGTKTCAGYPGTRGYEYQDARLYASWGVDYLKYDWCYAEDLNAKEAYATMSKAIRTAGRPMILSLCEWGNNKPWEWAKNIGHLWRTTGDIVKCWDCTGKNGVMKILDMQEGRRNFAGPGHWNDPDMLEVGNGLTLSEDRAHFSMWCMLAAPLVAGNDLRSMSKETCAVLTNKDAIAIDQDQLGIQGYKLMEKDSIETWIKPLSNNSIAVCFLNRSSSIKEIRHDWKVNSIVDSLSDVNIDFKKLTFKIYDVWNKREIGSTRKILKANILAHEVLLLKLSKQSI